MEFIDALFAKMGDLTKADELLRSPTDVSGKGRLGKRKRENPTKSEQRENASLRKMDDQRATKGSHEIVETTLKRPKLRITDLSALQNERTAKGKAKSDHFRVNVPPVNSFEQLRERFNVHPRLIENLRGQDYVEPTDVQSATLPLLLDSESASHLLTVAPTGSGKTVAFLIPLIQGIVRARKKTKTRISTAIILVPTKELLDQVVNEGRKLVVKTGVTISAVRKGMKIAGSTKTDEDDDESMKSGGDDEGMTSSSGDVRSDILVSTPLSLLNALSADGDETTSLPQIRQLVLDEADVLLDPLFREETMSVWNACISAQVTLWGATIGSNIEELTLSTIQEHATTSEISQHPKLLRCVVGLKDSAISSVSHRLIYSGNEHGKLLAMRELLRPPPPLYKNEKPKLTPGFPFLVYTQTIARAQSLHSELQYAIRPEAGGATRLAVLHSDLSDTKRAEIMTRFRAGEIWVLFTTDLLARGIDFRGVGGVVNFDIPTTAAGYVHRAGRTNRGGRSGGVAVTLWTNDDFKYVRIIANAVAASVRASGGSLEDVDGFGAWMLEAVPNVSKKEKKELKEKGVQARRGAREGDTASVKKEKRKARIGTQGGYLLRQENKRKGAIEASRRRKREERREMDQVDGNDLSAEWNGF